MGAKTTKINSGQAARRNSLGTSHQTNSDVAKRNTDVVQQRGLANLVDKLTGRPSAEGATLSDYEIAYLTDETGLSKHEIKMIFNKFVREASSGELTHEEFVRFYTSLSPDPPEFLNEYSKFVFDAFDHDHSGKVSFREFVIAYVLTNPKTSLEKKLDYTFSFYDIDQNGFLDRDEVFAIVTRIYMLIGKGKHSESDNEHLALQFLRKLDTSQDGVVTKGKPKISRFPSVQSA